MTERQAVVLDERGAWKDIYNEAGELTAIEGGGPDGGGVVVTFGAPLPDDDRVPAHDGCPHCGETRVDALIIDDDHVDCTTCGIGYWLYGVEVA